MALLILGAAVVLETISLLGCLSAINDLRADKTFRQWLATTRNAELIVVLGEDSAAIFGLIIAFVFVALSVVTGNAAYDAIGSIFIGSILIVVSIFVAWRIKALIIGTAAEPDARAKIEEIILHDKDIVQLFNVITIQFGAKIMLAVKIKLADDMPVSVAAEKINLLEVKIKQELPDIGWCFIEPDSKD